MNKKLASPNQIVQNNIKLQQEAGSQELNFYWAEERPNLQNKNEPDEEEFVVISHRKNIPSSQVFGASGSGVYLNAHQQQDDEILENQRPPLEQIESNPRRQTGPHQPKTNVDDISPLKLNSLRKKSEQLQNKKQLDQHIKEALQYEQKMQLGLPQNAMPHSSPIEPENNPVQTYTQQREEEKRREEERERQELEKIQQNEKVHYKLADYFLVVGVDDYHQDSEVYKSEKNDEEETKTPASNPVNPKNIDLNIMSNDYEMDFERVVSKLEIFVIRNPNIFAADYEINGVRAQVQHPEQIESENEKWIDLRGDQYIYLKVSYDDMKNCKRPICDLNFYKISRSKQQPKKMAIQVKQGIEPIPVKEYGDPEADTKFKKTKLLGKNGKTEQDMYNFYGDYDLTSYFEDPSMSDPGDAAATVQKNLCLCVSYKRQAPIQDVINVIGVQIDSITGQVQQNVDTTGKNPNLTINWDVPEGYKKLAYSVGTRGCLNRLLCLRNRDVMKRKLKAKILDRYPPEGQDRHYYPLPSREVSEFCFPSGVQLKTEVGQPEYFNFSLTQQEGDRIFGTVLIFDEEPSEAFKEKLKSYNVGQKTLSQVRTLKAICILSHYSFGSAFKEVLKQIYRMQVSQTRLPIPIERYIVNIMDEIPLPDEGKLLVQHEIHGETASFFRPTDQNPPIIDKDDVENLFKCLDVECVLEVYAALLLERKVVFISSHKALLGQVINSFLSFIFPFQWSHSLIPILPDGKIEVLEAPFPYLMGMPPSAQLEDIMVELESEVVRVDLDQGTVQMPNDHYTQSQIPKMPFKEAKTLKQRLLHATQHIDQVPDPMMMTLVDMAFNQKFQDPDEEFLLDHLEIRDAFLEFMSSMMSGYTKFLKDPSDQPANITCSADCFELEKFRLMKEAKKQFSFIYKLTETSHFSYFIECRALGRTDRDAQIMHFEKLLNQKRTRMNPRLIHPFLEEKSVKTIPVNEEGLDGKTTWSYQVFPKFNPELFSAPRQIPDYNDTNELLQQQIMGQLIKNEDLTKMHDNEWARYMTESLYMLWFQAFCSTLPIYSAHAQGLIDFARRLLNHIRSRLKPMRDIEFIYRRLFESCGTCKRSQELRDLHKEMLKFRIEPDKVTTGTYYQALLQCQRRGGEKEGDNTKKKSYFNNRMEDYQERLNNPIHRDDDNRSQNRTSNLSLGQRKLSSSKQSVGQMEEEHFGVVDFEDILDRRESHQLTQQTALDTQQANRMSNPMKLSHILENSLYLDIEKTCTKCKEPLREEELFTGFQKNLSTYTVKCPICSKEFVPKFSVHSEHQDSAYLKDIKDKPVQLLPPVTLYKEFFNIITKKGDQLLMSETFIFEHKTVFWNMVLYFKILRLPLFMLDLDYSPFHQKVHCSQIKKFLPEDKKKSLFGGMGGGGQSRKSSANRQQYLPPKLDSNALKRLNEIDSSPQRFGSSVLNISNLQHHHQGSDKDAPYTRHSQAGSNNGGRPSSIKRVANQMMGMFGSNTKKKNSQSNVFDAQEEEIQQPQIGYQQPPYVGGSHVPQIKGSGMQLMPPGGGKDSRGGIAGIHFANQNQHHSGIQSQAMENEKKGFQGIGGAAVSLFNNLKKPSSQKSGGKAGSQRSGGGSAVTSLSDLEKIEKIMNEAQHADKNIVKYFGKHLEEFRREMHHNKEIVFSDMLLNGIGDVPNAVPSLAHPNAMNQNPTQNTAQQYSQNN